MPILNTIQKRSVPGRLLLAFFYIILTFGAVWMVYPFLMMIGGSVKTDMDYRHSDLIPRFLLQDDWLFRKFAEQRYGRIDLAIAATGARDENGGRLYTFESFPVPEKKDSPASKDWEAFLGERREKMPDYYFSLGHVYGSRTIPELTFRYRQLLQKKFATTGKDLQFVIAPEEWNSRNYQPPIGGHGEAYHEMRESLPERYFYPISLDGNFAIQAVAVQYGASDAELARLNREWGTNYKSVLDARLRSTLPENPTEREIWSNFVRTTLSARFLVFDESLRPDFQNFLQKKYGEISEVNGAYNTSYRDWSEIPFPSGDAPTAAYGDAAAFVQGLEDLSKVSIRSVETEWRDYLAARYNQDITALNQSWGTDYASFDAIPVPGLEYDWKILQTYKKDILWDLITRNYRIAWNEVVLSGNGLRNTVIFCLLNILTALIVNPLAAYALSRFQPSWGHMALFLLMATMAFPAEVTQIPSFLLLRDLGWLNTFAALVIPAAANGYSIFLLKGFFDSLPRELYEAATIDGSGELRAFFTITLPLSAPILAVVALGAFAAAYGAFMFALLVCQKESMWTLMVYIYQLQQNYNPPIVFAALIIAALPTLVVFVLCQNIIMKGIVVPVEK